MTIPIFKKSVHKANFLLVNETELDVFESCLNYFNVIISTNINPLRLLNLFNHFLQFNITNRDVLCGYLKDQPSTQTRLALILSINWGTLSEDNPLEEANVILNFLLKLNYFPQMLICNFDDFNRDSPLLLANSTSNVTFYNLLKNQVGYDLIAPKLHFFWERVLVLRSVSILNSIQIEGSVSMSKTSQMDLSSCSQVIALIPIQDLRRFLAKPNKYDSNLTRMVIITNSDDIKLKMTITCDLAKSIYLKHPNLQCLDVSNNRLTVDCLTFLAKQKFEAEKIHKSIMVNINGVILEQDGQLEPLKVTVDGVFLNLDPKSPKVEPEVPADFFDSLYKNSLDPNHLKIQLGAFISPKAAHWIKHIYANPQLFLDAFFRHYNQDSLFRRWAIQSEGYTLINQLLTDDAFLKAFVQHESFINTLTSIHEENEEDNTSALYGLSLDKKLRVLTKIMTFLRKKPLIEMTEEMTSLFQKACFTNRNIHFDNEDTGELSDDLDSVITNFQKTGQTPTVIQTIKDFFNFLLGIAFPPEWEEPQKKGKRTIESYLDNDILFNETRTEPSCKAFNKFVEDVDSPLWIEFIHNGSFLNVLFKIQSRSLSAEILRGESVFHSWLKYDLQMLPNLLTIIHEKKDDPILCSGHLVSEALLCVSQNDTSALHLLFKNKHEQLLTFFKPVIVTLIQTHTQSFLALLLTSYVNKSDQTPYSLLTDLLNYEIQTADNVIKLLFNESNQKALLEALKQSPLLAKSQSLFFPLIKLNTNHPENTFFKTLLELNTSYVLEVFSDELLIPDLFKTSRKRAVWADLFKESILFDAWNKFSFKEGVVAILLQSCQQSILSNIASTSETKLPKLLESLVSHREIKPQLANIKFKKLNDWLIKKREDANPQQTEDIAPPVTTKKPLASLPSVQKRAKAALLPEPLLPAVHPAQSKASPKKEARSDIQPSMTTGKPLASIPSIQSHANSPEPEPLLLEFQLVKSKNARKKEKKKEALPTKAAVIAQRPPRRVAKNNTRPKATPVVKPTPVIPVRNIEAPVQAMSAHPPSPVLITPVKNEDTVLIKVWNLLKELEFIAQQKQLIDIDPAKILEAEHFLSNPDDMLSLKNYIDSQAETSTSIQTGPFLNNTLALQAIYVLKARLPIESMASFLSAFFQRVEDHSWLMQTIIHALVAYYSDRPLEKQAKDLLIKWIAQSQDIEFFHAFIAEKVLHDNPLVSNNLLKTARAFLTKQTIELDEAKLLYICLQFSIDSEPFKNTWITKVIELFNLEKIGTPLDFGLDFYESIEANIRKELPSGHVEFKEFICQVFLAEQVTEILSILKWTKNRFFFLRAQLQLIGLGRQAIDDTLSTLMTQELVKNPLATETLKDCSNELILPYLQPLNWWDNSHNVKSIDADSQAFFKARADLCALVRNMIDDADDSLHPCIVGSQAKFGAYFFEFNPQKKPDFAFNQQSDLDINILCVNRAPEALHDINALEQYSMIWLEKLASKVSALTEITSQIKSSYDPKHQNAWCSFKAKIANIPLDFRFDFTTLNLEAAIHLSRKERVLGTSAYLWDLRTDKIYSPENPGVLDYIKPINELSIRNMGYILWVIFCQKRTNMLREISYPLLEILHFILGPSRASDGERPLFYSKDKLITLISMSISGQFKKKMKEQGIMHPGMILNELRVIFGYNPVEISPIANRSHYFFNTIVAAAISPTSQNSQDPSLGSEQSPSLSQ